MDNDDEKVGYCKPPKKHQWKPRQSGNPKGRPKKPPPTISLDIAEIIRRLDSELIQTRSGQKPRREVELLILRSLELKGDKRARRLLDKLRMRRPPQKCGGVIVSTELWERSIGKVS